MRPVSRAHLTTWVFMPCEQTTFVIWRQLFENLLHKVLQNLSLPFGQQRIGGPGGPGAGYNGNPSRRLRTIPVRAGRWRNALARLGAGFDVKNHLKPQQRLPGALTNVHKYVSLCVAGAHRSSRGLGCVQKQLGVLRASFTPPRLAGLLSAKIGGPTHRWRPWEGAVRSVASRSKWPWRESTGGVRRVAHVS